MTIKRYEFQSFDVEEDNTDNNATNNENINIENDIVDDSKIIFEEYPVKNPEPEISILDPANNSSELINQEISVLLKNISSGIEKLEQDNNRKIDNMIIDFSKLTFDIAKKIAFKALDTTPISAIEQFFQDSFKIYKNEIELKILVNPEVLELLKLRIEEFNPNLLVKHKINFESDENLARYNCEINWYNGNIRLDKEEITKKIGEFFK